MIQLSPPSCLRTRIARASHGCRLTRVVAPTTVPLDEAPVMQHVAGSPLPAWESFYVIIGSSSAGLTGLMFVVMTLIPETRRRAANRTINAFATPNVVHFCAALLVSAMLSAPWHSLTYVSLLLG